MVADDRFMKGVIIFQQMTQQNQGTPKERSAQKRMANSSSKAKLFVVSQRTVNIWRMHSIMY